MTSPEELFVDTCRDLRFRWRGGSQYHLLLASSLVRKLLLDGTPLYILANRRTKLRLTFPFRLDPLQLTGGEVYRGFLGAQQGSLDGFLATECVALGALRYTVHEIVDAAAHKHGGVHLDTKATPKEVALLSRGKGEIHIAGVLMNPLLFGLDSIAHVTLESLDPLFCALAGESVLKNPVQPRKARRSVLVRLLHAIFDKT